MTKCKVCDQTLHNRGPNERKACKDARSGLGGESSKSPMKEHTLSARHVTMKSRGPGTALLWVLSTFGIAGALFVPEELPTLLSFLYTNIPPVFKGTDSRLGIGFRVGPNADFQVQLELGPQTRTQSLEQDSDGSGKKRHVIKQDLPAMTQHPVKTTALPVKAETPQDWLTSWKASVGSLSQEEEENDVGGHPVIDYDTVRHLQQLYREQPRPENGI